MHEPHRWFPADESGNVTPQTGQRLPRRKVIRQKQSAQKNSGRPVGRTHEQARQILGKKASEI